jgi:ABC-type multidrug transport system fused ATPase/permease subunit
VSFEYNSGQPVLRNITASIEPGQMVAFLGPSGTGKSTLLNLLPRFYDPTAGSVLLDGVDLRTLKVADVRKHMALVTQGSPLFPERSRRISPTVARTRPSTRFGRRRSNPELLSSSKPCRSSMIP